MRCDAKQFTIDTSAWLGLDWTCVWNDERVKSKQKHIYAKILQEKWEKRAKWNQEKKCKRSEKHDRVGKTATATAVAAQAIKAYILRKILYAKSKVERKSLWLKCLGKNCDILMKLLMLFLSRILFTFFFLFHLLVRCNVCVSLAFRNYVHFFHFFSLLFSSLPTRPPCIPCW